MKRAVVGDVILTEEEPGIVCVDYGTAIVTAELVADVLDRARELWGEDRVTVLVKAASATDLAKIGEVVSEDDLEAFTIACAIMTPGKLARLIGNLFMQFQRSPYPQKLFSDPAEARAWLRMKVAQDSIDKQADANSA